MGLGWDEETDEVFGLTMMIESELSGNRTGGNSLAVVLLVSGFMGFALGLSNATWQVTVESGQVLAGIVRYPADNPFYIYHVKLFTIINQISALLLLLIGSELFISILVSGLVGMVSFMGISTFIFAISRKPAISIVGVVLIYFANYVGDGAIYPIWLLGEPHTYGMLGLSFAVLTLGLLGSGAYRSGMFCLAMAPCVHPSLGVWVVVCVCVAAALNRGLAKDVIRRYYAYLLAGGFITLGSLAYQLHLMWSLPSVTPGEGKEYFDAFVRYWGRHQEKLYWGYAESESFRRWGIFFCVYSVVGCYLGRRLLGKNSAAVFMLTALMVSGVGGLLFGFLTQLPPESVPSVVLTLMPGRYVNLSNVTLAALLLGILCFSRNRPYVTNYNVFVLFLVGALLARHCEVQMVVFAVILCWLGYLVFRAGGGSRVQVGLSAVREHKVSYEVLAGLFLLTLLLINAPRRTFIDHFLVHPDEMNDRTNNEFFASVAESDGFLLTTHYDALICLKTRRRILLDMASPNIITYAPQSGPAFNKILKEVYGIDLLAPPPEQYRHQEIPPELYRRQWEGRTTIEWGAIGAEFGVTDVLTPVDWPLNLPIAAKGEGMILYEIPERQGLP